LYKKLLPGTFEPSSPATNSHTFPRRGQWPIPGTLVMICEFIFNGAQDVIRVHRELGGSDSSRAVSICPFGRDRVVARLSLQPQKSFLFINVGSLSLGIVSPVVGLSHVASYAIVIAGTACLQTCCADERKRTVALLLALLACEATWQRKSNIP